MSVVTAANGPIGYSIDGILAKGFMATDPSEASFGLCKPLEHRGVELISEAGTSVWHQLSTHDYLVAFGFFREPFS